MNRTENPIQLIGADSDVIAERLSTITTENNLNDTFDKSPGFAVAFVSKRKPDADADLLLSRDTEAHHEALASEGFIYYHQGEPGDHGVEGETMSFCLWTNEQEARATSQKPKHTLATKLTGSMYVDYQLHRFDVSSIGGQLVFEPKKESPAI